MVYSRRLHTLSKAVNEHWKAALSFQDAQYRSFGENELDITHMVYDMLYTYDFEELYLKNEAAEFYKQSHEIIWCTFRQSSCLLTS